MSHKNLIKNFWAICEPATGKNQLAEYLENYVYCILCSLGYSGICKHVRKNTICAKLYQLPR